MLFVLFDGNIYDRLHADSNTRDIVRQLVHRGALQIIMSRTVREELGQPKPTEKFGGLPDFFPIEQVGNTVARAGIMCAGDSLGSGNVYEQHLGVSNGVNDALIVDAADWHADWLVSADNALCRKAKRMLLRCKVLDYGEFVDALGPLSN